MNRFLNFFKSDSSNLKMTIKLDSIIINISDEDNGIRLTTENENWFIPRQTLDETKAIIEKNFKIIKTYFQDKLGEIITGSDLDNVSLKITLLYFQMYNHWRTMYKRERNRDLTFIQKDFEHPYTSNEIVDYFKNKYPDSYIEKCEIMLNMTNEQVKEYIIRKEQFDNK